MKQYSYKFFSFFIPVFAISSLLLWLTYAAVQYSSRSMANDPQIQIAVDVVNGLSEGSTINGDFRMIDISESLSPFVITLSEAKEVTYASAELNGETPLPPDGVLEYAKENDRNILTWEPSDNVRIAAVVYHYDENGGGYVISGRSLKEIEQRQNRLFYMFLTSFGVMTCLTITGSIFHTVSSEKKNKK